MVLIALFATVLSPPDTITVQVNGEPAKPGIVINGKAFVPVRGVFEKLGITVKWENSSVIASTDERTLVLWPHVLKAEIDGKEVPIQTAPETINGATYVPLRLIGETLGVAVVYNQKGKSVNLFTKGGMSADPAAFKIESWYFEDKMLINASGPPAQALTAFLPDREFPLDEKSPGVYSANTTFTPPKKANRLVSAYVTANGKDDHLTFSARPDPFDLTWSGGTKSEIVSQKDDIVFRIPPESPKIDTANTIVSIDGPQAETDVQPDKITIRLAPGKSVVSIHAVDIVGKTIDIQREFKAAPFVGYESSCDPLKPGDAVQVMVYANPNANVRLKIGSAFPAVKFAQTTPGEYIGQYVARTEDNINGQDLGVNIGAENVWAQQPPLRFLPFSITEMTYHHSDGGGTLLELNATPACTLSLIDRQGSPHPFTETSTGWYQLEIAAGGFPAGSGESSFAIKSKNAPENFEPQRFPWAANVNIITLPNGDTSQSPSELQILLEIDPLLCFKPNSWKVQLNGQPCNNVQLAARGFVVRNLPPLQVTNTAVFEAQDLTGTPVRFEWAFRVRG